MAFNFLLKPAHPIKIVDLDDDHSLVLNEKNLKSVLYHPKARNKKVVDYSLFGTNF